MHVTIDVSKAFLDGFVAGGTGAVIACTLLVILGLWANAMTWGGGGALPKALLGLVIYSFGGALLGGAMGSWGISAWISGIAAALCVLLMPTIWNFPKKITQRISYLRHRK